MTAIDIARHAHDSAARIALPIGSEQAGESRDKVDAAVVLYSAGERLDIRSLLDHLQVIPQPLDQRARDGDRAFQAIDSRLVADLVAEGSQQAILGGHGLGTGVEQHEAAGAICILRLACAEAGLTEEGSLLIA